MFCKIAKLVSEYVREVSVVGGIQVEGREVAFLYTFWVLKS